MCIVCERELWGEHRALEREFFKTCKTCKKFPGASTQGTCYHCFAVPDTIDECPGRPRRAVSSILAREDRVVAATVGLLVHHSTRRFPSTQSKCRSRLKSGKACCRQSAAIHRSLVGIGLPFRFNSRV